MTRNSKTGTSYQRTAHSVLRRVGYVLLVGVDVLSSKFSLGAYQSDEEVTVETSSTKQNVVLTNIELSEKKIQLECFLSERSRKAPKEGSYFLVRLPVGEGSYMDCPNVSLYEKTATQKRASKVGEYCLLE